METTREVDEFDDDQRDVVADFVRRLRRGDSMAEIFGVGDEALEQLEAQMYRLYRNRRFEQAKVAGRGILALDGERGLVHLLLGDIALEEYCFSRAVEHLEVAYRLEPELPVVRARLGEALIQFGEIERGRRHLTAVIEDQGDSEGVDIDRCRALLGSIDDG